MFTALVAGRVLLQQSDLDGAITQALSTAGLSQQTAKFDPAMLALYRQGEFATPLYTSIIESPWQAPFKMGMLRADIEKQIGSPSDTLISLGRLAGFGPRRSLLGNPIQAQIDAAKKAGALDAVFASLKQQNIIKGPIPSTLGVPAEVQQAAALILSVDRGAYIYRQLAVRNIDIASAYALLAKPSPSETEEILFQNQLDLDRKMDMGYLAAGAYDLTLASQTAAALCETVKPEAKYDFELDTAWGKISLSGGEDSNHSGASLLIIDTGGNDTYLNVPSNSGPENWSSVCIDTSGADKYLSDSALANRPIEKWEGRKNVDQTPGPAGALLGYSVLIDSSGDDLYRSHGNGLGSGRYGFAVLLDKQGNDEYDAYQNSEGYGEFGVGILEDMIGSDHYSVFTQGQGMGFVMGVGALIDALGDDTYVANDTTIDFPSAQSDKHNNSMSQGAGYGYRRDYLDVHSLAGGVGILFDLKGNDTYSCGVFGQGVGYWEGVGCLWDTGGDDTYTGQWYVQGAAAHYAVGYLEDTIGNDHYNAGMNMAQGAGHDFSIGYLLDHAGNDVYRAPNLSLGAGNDNGMGIFVDMAGDDNYNSSGTTLGKANPGATGTLRERAFSLGFFMDLGGNDSYPAAATWAGNGKTLANWTTKGPFPWDSQLGIFADR